ncbi:LacI family DNA-binding transcriptional regulator [Streptomyces sp. NBC_00878]|uniref:LacI family DNA-binding transcriptional regulator n=1 Tax=Streptomyces sp. NBC_00878 TaxID=2975854 RepID=UPI002257AAE8|nr:LacI family DNA-binding transcriptional regulator [Streptomyces sp. NBC_00878]MCX4905489.1 LacI family transcriptional regulator [Streptomyces sp. NBC_00878]
MPEHERRSTSADVARVAGVARSTVSYVMNNHPHQKISEPTRRRVLEAAEQLGYRPSAAARALRRGRTDLVLCLMPDFPVGHTLGSFLPTLSTAFGRHGFTFVIHPTTPHEQPLREVWQAIAPAAIVSLDALGAADLADVRDLGIPVAEVVYEPVDDGLAGITLPNLQFGTVQAEYLIATGHTRIGFAYPADERLRRFAEPRLAGVREACRAAGLPEPDVRTVALDVDSAALAASAWTGAEPSITAVCAYNDETAIGLLAAARSLGMAVPTKLAVIGVDDIPTAVFADPPLTTVRADFAGYAERLADLVVAATNGVPAAVPTPAGTVELITRHSA